jgi:hypothetical protein
VRRSYTGGAISTPKNRERRDVDLITDVVDVLAQSHSRYTNGHSADGLVFHADGDDRFFHRQFSSAVSCIRRCCARAPADRPDAGGSHLPQLPAHVREARAREPRSDCVALTPPRPLNAEGNHRYLRALGAGGAQAPGSQGGGGVPQSDVTWDSQSMRRHVARQQDIGRVRFAGLLCMGRAGIEPATLGLKVPCSTD